MTNTIKNLSPKRRRAIVALLRNPGVCEAALEAGVKETTLLRWLGDEEFADAYREARRQAVLSGIAHLQHSSTAAVSTMVAVMEGADTPPNVKVSAAKALLDMALEAMELQDMEARLSALESSSEEESSVVSR